MDGVGMAVVVVVTAVVVVAFVVVGGGRFGVEEEDMVGVLCYTEIGFKQLKLSATFSRASVCDYWNALMYNEYSSVSRCMW